jgi:hypothetical protein
VKGNRHGDFLEHGGVQFDVEETLISAYAAGKDWIEDLPPLLVPEMVQSLFRLRDSIKKTYERKWSVKWCGDERIRKRSDEGLGALYWRSPSRRCRETDVTAMHTTYA